MDTSSLGEKSLAFDLNISSDAREKDFEVGLESHVVGNKPSSLGKKERDLIDELNQMKSEKNKLIEMLIISYENYNALKAHLVEIEQKYSGDDHEVLQNSKKRKFDQVENSISFMRNDTSYDSVLDDGSPKRPREIRTNISRVCVRVDPSDTSLVVKDGYHWRKYGQKVTKDNPSPRAYYKCSFAPSCQVKKKVQRSVGDPSILIATYEGEHNHQHPMKTEMLISSAQGAAAAFTPSLNCFEDPSPRDRVGAGLAGNCFEKSISARGSNGVGIQQLMVEHMASSLTRNPSFTAAIAAAISERILSHDPEMDDNYE